ncbi:hypothetical protein C8A01DRAFT_21590, partial [Parachaetomium inaequale]
SSSVKYDSAEDNGIKRLLGELTRWRDQARDSAARQPQPTEAQIQGPVGSSFYNYGGDQVNAPGGIVNISRGSGNQLPGAIFSGPVMFTSNPEGALLATGGPHRGHTLSAVVAFKGLRPLLATLPLCVRVAVC